MPNDYPNVQIHTADVPQAGRKNTHKLRLKIGLSLQDRLLRNSFLACAVLLGILALGNVNAPWASKASEGIKQALTMKIDLDESLGQMHFVQKLMPESIQVFFNLSGGSEFAQPVQGTLAHEWDTVQPWLMFECSRDADILAVSDGIVSAVSPLSDGSWGVLIDHGSGTESVLAGLQEVLIQAGDEVGKGKCIGKCSESLYFELRENGESTDPSQRMDL